MRAGLSCVTFLLAAIAAAFFMPSTSQAHDPRPLHITMTADQDGAVILRSKIPNSLSAKLLPLIWLEAPCTSNTQSDTRLIANSYVTQTHYTCDAAARLSLRIEYPYGNPSLSALIHLRRDTQEIRTLLSPGTSSWQEPSVIATSDDVDTKATPQAETHDLNFLDLGIRHILSGYDHLAFVLGLLLIAGHRLRIIWAVTSFTLGHSISLIAASFGFLTINIGFVEILIAASILLLARELYERDGQTLIWRFPALLALGFGLIHGLGFASVLTELEIGADNLLWSLINFNIGVEIGQLGFVFVVLALFAILERSPLRVSLLLRRRAVSAVIGVGASYWIIERLVSVGLF